MPRMYEEVWTRLKSKDIVQLHVNPINYRRVRAGIIKEKNRDIAFKIMNDNGETFRLKFKYEKEKHHLVVKLKQQLGIEEKVVT